MIFLPTHLLLVGKSHVFVYGILYRPCSLTIVCTIMSDYFNNLSEEAKKRYLEKLKLIYLAIEDDPYSSKSADKFVKDMCLWPAIEYGHIFCYFINRPEIYTKEQLLSRKQMDAFNYFQSGHVRDVFVREASPKALILKGFVNPSQKVPSKGNEAWIAVQKDGQILLLVWLGELA